MMKKRMLYNLDDEIAWSDVWQTPVGSYHLHARPDKPDGSETSDIRPLTHRVTWC